MGGYLRIVCCWHEVGCVSHRLQVAAPGPTEILLLGTRNIHIYIYMCMLPPPHEPHVELFYTAIPMEIAIFGSPFRDIHF